MHRLSLQAITAKDRASVTWDLKETLQKSGAWITQFQIFSNKATGVQFELYFETVAHLAKGLAALELGFQEGWQKQFDALENLYLQNPELYQEKEITGSLNITFEHDEPELIIPVPMVPG